MIRSIVVQVRIGSPCYQHALAIIAAIEMLEHFHDAWGYPEFAM